MNASQDRPQSGAAEPAGGNPSNYEVLCNEIAVDLARAAADKQVSTARLVGYLSSEIQSALERGIGYGGVARVFTQHGIATNADAVRVALDRKRRRASDLTSNQRRPRADLDAPAVEHSPGGEQTASTVSDSPLPEPIERSPSASPDVAVGRHLD